MSDSQQIKAFKAGAAGFAIEYYIFWIALAATLIKLHIAMREDRE